MSDTEKGGGKGGSWADPERFAYILAAIEHSGIKLDFKEAPRPEGRSVIACQRMIERLKGTVKNEIEALKTGQPIPVATPKKRAKKGEGKDTPKSSKRKVKADEDGDDADESSKKKVKKTVKAEVEEQDDTELIREEDASENSI